MPSRSQRSPKERDARSRAVQRIADRDWLRGSLVEMARLCGKPGCRCLQGHKHRSLYLAVRRGHKRSLIYIPASLEQTVRQWVQTAHEIDDSIDFISQQCLEQLLEQKKPLLHHAPQRPRRQERPP